MPLDRMMLLLVIAAAALVACVWLVWLAFVAAALSPLLALALCVPTALAGYIAIRLIVDRVGNPEEDHYDDIEN